MRFRRTHAYCTCERERERERGGAAGVAIQTEPCVGRSWDEGGLRCLGLATQAPETSWAGTVGRVAVAATAAGGEAETKRGRTASS